ncbi:hypothetical protein [Microbacterium lacticum]|uniref:hypothetical protein n=1 Tax=Microbacterium lacticum TaxID=33885 RepID=UPI001F5873F5|nr:hypothetical protein [Microbacterium lacticum]
MPIAVLRADGVREPMPGARIDAVNDQHAFVRTGSDRPAQVLGDRVLLGLSHPCTMFDKWRPIPVVGDLDEPDPVIVGFIETRF